ncbi:inverse autotransporter beta domain-containing protein [Xenorhabdus khoisanae]|uniref:inverse autotransporter beta domain-containing protein n=1 Tax=Xenorhabdus khoisanae TaxID=880157 RepID=UPI0023584697|nr:inverse autotransporter beta domain-containing protein [Xenorhabdus khoisanae]MDC9613672.1 inverse autotransporter beta domain-containing protein [Xenorhabdus khoisanae]
MDSYINRKVIRLSVLLYSLSLPFIPVSAFSTDKENHETKTERKFSEKTQKENRSHNENKANNHDENADVGAITRNIQHVGQLLSSSPSELTEQAKSYALGKINNSISTETQKWLSQFGTAKINFSLDRKGKLDNGSLDLLLPFYDNKADWLLFSQLGYRNKDNRHTVNLGFGGRYFTPTHWMYGLNSFYDHEITGSNQRLGLGAEAWTDYLKLSANTYWRLSQWHQSPKEQGYEERPANGFDLNSEFFLPAYPNLGGKLSYEQYFGDNVALFNRDTKQKNPSLTRFGLNYTPIPLITMGVDYKLGTKGNSETLFLANLNYRFGIPFDMQISPHNVASLRTLTGSRYDVVQRNNNIVLDYRKKSELSINLPSDLSGYSTQLVRVNAKITANKPLKPTIWTANKEFRENGGVIAYSDSDYADVTLPKYNTQGGNRYILSATVETKDGSSVKKAQTNLTVEPFVIKDQSIRPIGDGPAITDGKPAYNLAATITYGNTNNVPLKDVTIPNVKWSLDPPTANAKLEWDTSGALNKQGQLIATLASTATLDKNTKVYLEIADMPKVEIKGDKPITFIDVASKYSISDPKVEPEGPLSILDENNIYTFKATILDENKNPLKNQKIEATWHSGITGHNNDKVVFTSSTTTNDQNQLIATLKSTEELKDVIVKLSINGDKEYTFKPVSFVDDSKNIGIKSINLEGNPPYIALGNNKPQTINLVIHNERGTPYYQQPIPNLKWFTEPEGLEQKGLSIKPQETSGQYVTDPQGQIAVHITSTQAMKDVRIGFSVNGGKTRDYSESFDFVAPTSQDLGATLTGDITTKYYDSLPGITDRNGYVLKVKVIDKDKKEPIRNQSIEDMTWATKWKGSENHLPEDFVVINIPDQAAWTTDSNGYVTAYLTRAEKKGEPEMYSPYGIKDIMGTVKLSSGETLVSAPVNFDPQSQEAKLRIYTFESSIHKPTDSYKDVSEQEKPFTWTNMLYFYLVRNDGKSLNIDEFPEGKFDIKTSTSDTGIEFDNDNGMIFTPTLTSMNAFNPGPVTVTVRLTESDTGKLSDHYYKFNPHRYFFFPEITVSASVPHNELNKSCENLEDFRKSTTVTMDDIGIGDVGGGNSYSREFPVEKFPQFGLFYSYNTTPYIRIKESDADNAPYLVYNYKTGKMEEKSALKEDAEINLVCKLK